jgi:hypothetical protein
MTPGGGGYGKKETDGGTESGTSQSLDLTTLKKETLLGV